MARLANEGWVYIETTSQKMLREDLVDKHFL
jgi:hypothetical protein